MKRPILDSRRKVISAVICAYPGGRDCAAARLGLELKKFDNMAYENAGHRPLTDDQVHIIEQASHRMRGISETFIDYKATFQDFLRHLTHKRYAIGHFPPSYFGTMLSSTADRHAY
jgi:hypothetical protein